MIILNEIRVKLRETISQSGMKQSEIAKELGVSQQTVSHYMKGDKMPALDMFANLCRVLDVDANEILCVK